MVTALAQRAQQPPTTPRRAHTQSARSRLKTAVANPRENFCS